MKIYLKRTLIPTILNDGGNYSTTFLIQPKLESTQNVLLWCKMFHKKIDFIIMVRIGYPSIASLLVSMLVSYQCYLQATALNHSQSRPFPDEAECPDWRCQTNFIWPNWCHQAELLSLVWIHEKLKTHNLWTKDSKFEIEDWRLGLQAGLISAVQNCKARRLRRLYTCDLVYCDFQVHVEGQYSFVANFCILAIFFKHWNFVKFWCLWGFFPVLHGSFILWRSSSPSSNSTHEWNCKSSSRSSSSKIIILIPKIRLVLVWPLDHNWKLTALNLQLPFSSSREIHTIH